MNLKDNLQQIFNSDFPGTETFISDVVKPVFGYDIHIVNIDQIEKDEYREKAAKAGLKKIVYVADIKDEEYRANNIAFFDVTVDNRVNVERARVNIQQVIRSIVDKHSHILMVFHYENVEDKPWRFSYAYKQGTIASTTSAKRYTYVFGRDFRGRTAAERFVTLKGSDHSNKALEEAFSVEALSDKFFERYRELYADFVQHITGKRYEKIKNKWVEVKYSDPDTEIFSQFNNDDKRVRDYIKKMMGRLTFLCFLQRKGWMNNDRNFLQNLYQTSPLQTDFLDSVLEPLFFGVLNTHPEKRKEVFAKNGWNTDLVDEWNEIPYLNGGLFEQTGEDKLTVKFPKKLFQELFKFLGEYNFTIDENDPDDAEIGIDPEMLGRVFESLLEDNKDKGAFYTPKEIVQYMCRQSIIEYLKTHTDQLLHADIEDLINKGLVNHALQNKDNARNLYKLLKEVTVCDPAIGSGAFPMGILNILFTARQHLYGFLKESKPFDPLEVKKAIIRNNIYGVDIEQGAVDIARLRFWLAILLEEQQKLPLPNLDYRIVRGNSLITTFNDEYIQLPENPDGRTKLAKLKKELHQLQNDLFDLNGDEKSQREIDIKCKILEIIKVQLGIDKANAQEESRIESDIFEDKKLSGKTLKKAQKARAIEVIKSKSLFALNKLITSLTTPATSLADRAQIDIKFFDWKIVFPNIFNEDNKNLGFDIMIGNPPYLKEGRASKSIFDAVKHSPYYQGKMDIWYMFACRGIDMLRYGGNLCFIATNNWTTNAGAQKLRTKIIEDTKILQLCDFRDYMVFTSASIQTMIMLLKKLDNNTHLDKYKFDYRQFIAKGSGVEGLNNMLSKTQFDNVEYLTPVFDTIALRNNTFNFANSIFSIILNKIEKTGSFHLDNNGDLTEITSGVDVLQDYVNKKAEEKINHTHCIGEGVFVVDEVKRNDIAVLPNEKNILKPYYTTEQLTRYCNISCNREWLIYCGAEMNKVIDNYPNIKRHLDQFADIMTSANKPYGLHRTRKQESFEGSKILSLRKCVDRPSFSYVDTDSFVSRAFMVINSNRINLKYLTGLLNSKVVAFWLRHRGKMQGLNFQIDKGPLQSIPIVIPAPKIQDRIIRLVDRIIDSIRSRNPEKTVQLENQIDQIVYHLYDFTYDEVLIVDPQTPISREEYKNKHLN